MASKSKRSKPNPDQASMFAAPLLPKKGYTHATIKNAIWTDNKSRLVQFYLQYFCYVTKHGTYIDGFAGPQYENEIEMWSAKRVLEEGPKLLRHFYLFDIDPEQVVHLKKLAHKHRRRDVRVVLGDFNDVLPNFLRTRPMKEKEATFCLLDQRAFECDWATVETLARYKKTGNKIELFYFLPVGWLGRSMAGKKLAKDEEMVKWWGREDWQILEKKTQMEHAELFCQRFRDLGYKHVAPWPIFDRNQGGRRMYFMIHASDHDDAPKLMHRAYENTVRKLTPKWRDENIFPEWENPQQEDGASK